jgi:hypothetical protein
MRIIDTAIPKLGLPPAAAPVRPIQPAPQSHSTLPISSNAFTGIKKQEYVVDEEHDDTSTISRSQYFDAESDPSVWECSERFGLC